MAQGRDLPTTRLESSVMRYRENAIGIDAKPRTLGE